MRACTIRLQQPLHSPTSKLAYSMSEDRSLRSPSYGQRGSLPICIIAALFVDMRVPQGEGGLGSIHSLCQRYDLVDSGSFPPDVLVEFESGEWPGQRVGLHPQLFPEFALLDWA